MTEQPPSINRMHSSNDRSDSSSINNILYNYHLQHSERLSSLSSSSSFSIGAHNVNSFCQTHKQLSFKQAVLTKQLDFVAILDTRINAAAVVSCSSLLPDYQSFWAPLSSDHRCGGIGLYIKSPYNKFVQKLSTWRDLLLAVDLFMPGRRLRLIIVYCPPCSTSNNQTRKDLLAELTKWTSDSDREYYITGDFNTNADKFRDLINSCSHTPIQYALLKHFHCSNMVELFPEYQSYRIPTYTRRAQNTRQVLAKSRIDSIWISQSMHVDVVYTETWDTGTFYTSDHSMVIAWLAKSHLFSSLSLAIIKQHRAKKFTFQLSSMTPESWSSFGESTDVCLSKELLHHPPSSHGDSSPRHDLNRLWDILSISILKSAKKCIPRSWSSSHSNRRIPDDLAKLYSHLSAINRILLYFSKSRLALGTTPGYFKWQIHRSGALKLGAHYDGLTLSLPVNPSDLPPERLKFMLRSLKAVIKVKCRLAEQQWASEQISLYTSLRCDNYSIDISRFIDSALERCKRSIVLDRVLVISSSGYPQFLIALKAIDRAVVNHFQNYVQLPTKVYHTLDELPIKWAARYSPLNTVDA